MTGHTCAAEALALALVRVNSDGATLGRDLAAMYRDTGRPAHAAMWDRSAQTDWRAAITAWHIAQANRLAVAA